MTDRKIVLTSCTGCHHRSHSGSFTPGGAIPQCGAIAGKGQTVVVPDVYNLRGGKAHTYPDKYWSVLPFVERKEKGRTVRSYTGEIPDWCPLPENN